MARPASLLEVLERRKAEQEQAVLAHKLGSYDSYCEKFGAYHELCAVIELIKKLSKGFEDEDEDFQGDVRQRLGGDGGRGRR